MEKILYLVIVAFATVDGVLLGTEKCTWGPSYWCSHISRAKECGAIQHCMDSVWSKHVIQKTQSAECTLCQILINETRQMIKNKATQETILNFFKSGCNFLPDDSLKKQCDLIVQDYFPEFFKLLTSYMTSEEICAVIQICSGFEEKAHVTPEKSKAPKAPEVQQQQFQARNMCADCLNFLNDLKQMVTSNITTSELEMLFKQAVCSQLGEFESECDSLIDQYVPVFLQTLSSQVDSTLVCRMMAFCNTGDLGKALKNRVKLYIMREYNKKSIGKTEQCTMCETMMKDAQDFVRDPTEQAKIKSFIEEKICPELGLFSQQCKNMTEQYATMAFDLFVNMFDPDAACVFLGFCGNTTAAIHPKLAAAKIATSAVKVRSSFACEGCKLAVTEIKSLLEQSKTEEEIKGLIDEICNSFSSTIKEECTSVVNMYLPAIIELLEQELDPEAICKEIKLCTTTSKVQKTIPKVIGTADCDMCTEILTFLKNLFNNKSFTEKDIEAALDKVCALVPSYKSQCTQGISSYLPTVIAYLEEADVKQLCQTGGFCAAGKLGKSPWLPVTRVKSGEYCGICKLVTQELDSLIKEQSVQKEIETALDQVCSLLPDEYKQQCDNLVPVIINILVTELSQDTLCNTLGLCSSVGKLGKSPWLPVTRVKNGEYCGVCKLVAQELDSLIKEQSVQKEIETALDQVCSLLPDEYKQQCDNLVPVIINILVSELSQDTLCTTLGLCSSLDSIIVKKSEVRVTDKTCQICTAVLTEIKKIVAKYNQTQITHFLSRLCDLVPSYSSQCKSMINNPVVTAVLQELRTVSADSLCKQATLCTAGKLQVKPVKTTPTCALCELAMTELKKLIKKNSTEAEIEAALEKVCGILPAELTDECNALVDQYGKIIIDLLVQDIDAEKICQAIGLCSSGRRMRQRKPEGSGKQTKTSKYNELSRVPLHHFSDVVLNADKTTDTKCLLCETFVNYLSEALLENSTEVAIQKFIEEVCSDLPGDIGTECTALAKEYGIQLIQMLQQKIDPEVICQDIKLCSNSKTYQKAQMLAEKMKVMKPKYVKDTTLRFRSKQSQLNNKAVLMEMKPKSGQRMKSAAVNVINELKSELPNIKRKVEGLEKKKLFRLREIGRKKFLKKAEKFFLNNPRY